MRRLPTPHAAAPATDLHVCAACSRPFVVPHRILEVLLDRRYVVERRCNGCGWSGVGTYDEDTMEALDRELDRSQEQLTQAAEVMYVLNELEEIDAFAAALAAYLILPEDF